MRRVLTFFLVLGIVVAILIAFLPKILSSTPARQFVLDLINERIEGNVHIESLDLHWFSPITVRKFALVEKGGAELLSLDSLQIEKGLFSLLFSREGPINFELVNLQGQIQIDEQGHSNIQEALSRAPSSSKKKWIEGIDLHEVEGRLTFTDKQELLYLHFEGHTIYDHTKGHFSLLFDRQHQEKLHLEIDKFPLRLLENALLLQTGVSYPLVENLGEMIDGTLALHGDTLLLTIKTKEAIAELTATYIQSPLQIFPKMGSITKMAPSPLRLDFTIEGLDLLHVEKGPIALSLQTADMGFSSQGTLQKMGDRLSVVEKPFQLQIRSLEIKKALWNSYLTAAGLLFDSQDPWTLSLSKESFFSLDDPIKGELKGQVTVGKLFVGSAERGDLLHEIFSLLKIQGRAPTTLEITPLFFALSQEKATLLRADFLIDERLPFALWGTVDLTKELGDFKLAIFEKTLAETFRLRLPPNYTLVATIRGPLSSPTVDKRALTPAIGALALAAAMPDLVPGAGLWQKLASTAHTLFSGPIPPPTTDPLPWPLTSSSEVTPKEAEPEQVHPLENVEKKAKKLIKKLFKG